MSIFAAQSHSLCQCMSSISHLTPGVKETQLQVRPASRVKQVEKRTNVMLYPTHVRCNSRILTGCSLQRERRSYILGQVTVWEPHSTRQQTPFYKAGLIRMQSKKRDLHYESHLLAALSSIPHTTACSRCLSGANHNHQVTLNMTDDLSYCRWAKSLTYLTFWNRNLAFRF
jgi:hypothetical protein